MHSTHPVVAQVWRDGSRQARLSGFLNTITIHPLDDGRTVGRLLAQTRTSDVVDAHLAICAARLGHDVVTSDFEDLTRLTTVLGPAAPIVRSWP